MTRHAGPDLHLTVSRLEPFTTYYVRVQACQRGDVPCSFFKTIISFFKIQRFLNIELSRVVQRSSYVLYKVSQWNVHEVTRQWGCFQTFYVLVLSPSRRVWSRWRCVCSDPRCRTRRPVAPRCKSSRSPRLGDKLVSPQQTQRADHILPYIQVTHACNTGYCTHKNSHGTHRMLWNEYFMWSMPFHSNKKKSHVQHPC